MVSVSNIYQLGGDAEPISNFPHTALEDCSNIELFPDLPHVGVSSLEEKGGSSSRHMEAFDLRQHIDDLFGNTIGKEFVLRIRAYVDKRKHCDGVTRDAYGRSGVCADHSLVDRSYEAITAARNGLDEARVFS